MCASAERGSRCGAHCRRIVGVEVARSADALAEYFDRNDRVSGRVGCSVAGVIGSQRKPCDGGVEFGKVVGDGGGDDRVRDVEVAMREPVAHRGDLRPRDAGLSFEQVITDALEASPISMSRTRTASKIRLSDSSPRCRCARIAVIAAVMSASRCASWRLTAQPVQRTPCAARRA